MGTYKENKQVYDVKRSENRIKGSYTVNVKFGDKIYSGIAGNISKTGIYIETIGMNPRTNEEIEISFAGESTIYDLFGEIRWDRRISGLANKDLVIFGMGIKLHSVPVEYLNFVEYEKIL